jgi:hypothetical protein
MVLKVLFTNSTKALLGMKPCRYYTGVRFHSSCLNAVTVGQFAFPALEIGDYG